jgi:predicted LPLAT superfamily acyltransferase
MNSEPAWNGQSKGSAAGTQVFVWLISRFGVAPAYFLLLFVSLFYAFADRKSARAIRSLRTRLGLPTFPWHVFRHCFSFGMSIIDRYAFLTGRQSFFSFESHGESCISQAAGRGKGIILLGAHVGNWEIAGNLLSERLDSTVYYLMMDAERQEMRSVFKKALDARKIVVLPADADGLDLTFALRDALGKNGIVCMHGDRAVSGRKTENHNFLGRDVGFPVGPFAIGAATEAPVIPIMVTKTSLRRYVFRAYAPILFDGVTPQNRDRYLYTAMERYVGILEQVVKEKPHEWFNFYDFWDDTANAIRQVK